MPTISRCDSASVSTASCAPPLLNRRSVLMIGVKTIIAHLVRRERQPFPIESVIAFKNAPRVALNVAAGEIIIAEIEHPRSVAQRGRDFIGSAALDRGHEGR